MNEDILRQAGLTKAETSLYVTLVKNSPAAPPFLADSTGESRTNTYKLLDSLEGKGLVSRDDTQKKLRYWANNPSILLDGLKKRRTEIEAAEKRYQNSLPAMLDEYFKYSTQPSIRYFNGIDGVAQVYEDQLNDRQPITYVLSGGAKKFYGEHALHLIRNKYPALGIPRKIFSRDITPTIDPSATTIPVDESDKRMLLERVWMDEGDITQPVEWSVYGNKVSIISFGAETVGMIIESPQIAASFLELLQLLERKIKSSPGYDNHPKHLTYTREPESGR